MNRVINHLIKESLKKVKDETKEATGAGSAGGFTGPAFSMWSDDDEAKSEYKKSEPVEGEFTEATGSGSVGAYDAPGFEDVNMRGNTLRGSGRSFKKTQIPGGGFVSIDKKCKKFPYCSQGDSKDKPVKIITPSKGKRKKSPLSEAIENISLKTGLSVDEIKNIILKTINKTL
jgi:hypothetical protein